MIIERTLYSVLGVAPDAPLEVIKAAYRALAKQYHPDGAGAGLEEATVKFIELQEAYSVISDEERRAEYDRATFGELTSEVPIDEEAEAEINPDEVWEIKARAHPEIVGIHEILARYSSALANRFMLAVLNGECDADPASFALELDVAYFKKYFGNSPELQGLGRRLLQSGLRPAAKSLNKAIQSGRFDSPVKAQRLVAVFERILRQNTAEEQRTEVMDGTVFDEATINHDGSRRPRYGLSGGVAGVILFLLLSIGLIYSTAQARSEPEKRETAEVAPASPSDQIEALTSPTYKSVETIPPIYQNDQIEIPSSPNEQFEGDLAEIDAFELCNGALNSSKNWWISSSIFAVEAENRGLSVDQCRQILGLSSSQSDKVALEKLSRKKIYDRIVGEQEVLAEGNPIVLSSGGGEITKTVEITKSKLDYPQVQGNEKTNAPTQEKSTISQSLSSKLLCFSALASSYESSTVSFSTIPANQEKVKEVRRRGLDAKDCIAMLQTASKERTSKSTDSATNQNAEKPQRKVALVVGNSNYRKIPWLDNSSHDARAMADSLAAVGFEVTLVLDATQSDLRLALLEFSQTLADNTDVALLYYSGHAVQVAEDNYLLPIEVDNQDGDEIALSSVTLSEVIQVMDAQRVPTKILILDACRDNPLNDAGGRGLATVKAGMGTFIAYSTQPGNVAEDGTDKQNSPYTAALVEALKSPNGSIEETFKQVRVAVAKATEGRQVPWESSSLVEEFTFGVSAGSVRGTIKNFASALKNSSVANLQQPNEMILSQMATEENCLARAIYFEAKSDSEQDQLAVANRVFDRVRSPAYPKSICGVVYRYSEKLKACDFSFACNGVSDDVTNAASWVRAKWVARKSISGDEEITGILFDEAVAKLNARKKIPLETAYSNGDDEELGGMTEDAAAAPAKPKLKPETTEDNADEADATVADSEDMNQGYPVPKPRPKPIEVLMMAAAYMKIDPASAPPPDQTARTSPVAGNSQGYVIAPESITETASLESNAAAKTSLTEEIENGSAQNVPTIRNVTASASGDDLFWWPQELIFDSNKAAHRDGAPQQFQAGATAVATMLPHVSDAQAEEPPQAQRLAVAEITQSPAEDGKGDMLVVNREGKGSLLVSATTLKLGQADPSQQ